MLTLRKAFYYERQLPTRALTQLVGKRRALLDYLYDRDINRYRAIIKALGLRK